MTERAAAFRPSIPRPLWLLAGAAAAAGAAVLYRFPPLAVGWYPRCPLLVLTGLYCPGCGALRAGHALLHGHLGEALGYNPLLVLALPILAYVLAGHATDALAGRRLLPRPALPGRASWAVVALIFVYGAARNLPFFPFTALAP